MSNKSLFYPVSKIPIVDILPDYLSNPQKGFAIVTEIDGKQKILNLCSKGYTLVKNEDIITFATERLNMEGFQVKLVSKQYDDAKFFFDFILNPEKYQFALKVGNKKDFLVPQLHGINSYDGSIKYNWSATIRRLVCSNGLSVTMVLNASRKRHTRQLEGDKSLDWAMEIIADMLARSAEFLEPFEQLVDQNVVDVEDRVEEVVENTPFPKTLSEKVIDRINLETQMFELRRANDWLVYNGFNYELNHNFEDTVLKEHKRDLLDTQIQKYLLEN